VPPSLIPTIVLNLGLRTGIARRNSVFVAPDEVRSVSEGRGYGRDACGRDDTASGGDCERDARHPMVVFLRLSLHYRLDRLGRRGGLTTQGKGMDSCPDPSNVTPAPASQLC
jgi:hypothetical protein